jgi:mono/diheme cytochrome c family protein
MKKVKFRHSTSRFLLLSVVFLLSFSAFTFSQEKQAAPNTEQPATEVGDSQGSKLGDPANGKSLFNSLCAACHKPYTKSIGPALNGVTDRVSVEWIKKWVHNSAAVIASGDPEAVAIFDEFNKMPMPAFPQLTDSDIGDILAYVETPKPEPQVAAGTATLPGGEVSGSGVSSNIILGILAFVLLMLLVILFLVNKTLTKFAVASGVELPVKQKRTPIWKSFIQNQFLVLVTAIFLLLTSAYFVYGFFMQVGIDQGYQPIQPIHFSHLVHAGDNQVDCKYCHSAARTSKQSGIPSLNVCMNCHKSIGEVAEATATEEYSKEFYDKEIAKLYDAVGWDPATLSYTGETKPVKWLRIHNLPDFAYFNHSQHVTVAGVACQTCHGPIQEMEIVAQNAPLTMGWCINCHRTTNVNMADNEYYEKIHEELSKKYGVEDLTAAQLGGLECAKCHY